MANDKPKKNGRPRKEIDKDLFENLCAIFCTEEEIASVFECSIDTINRWCKRTYKDTFAEVYKRKNARGKASLRREQFKSAQSGNATMLIWLGKQWLNQKDRQDVSLDMEKDYTLNIVPASSVVNQPDNGSDGE